MSHMLCYLITCHAGTLDKATVDAVVRVRTAVVALQMSVANITRALRLVALAETAKDPIILSCLPLSSKPV